MSRMSEFAIDNPDLWNESREVYEARLAHYEHERRAAACLKACEGISTEALEAGVVDDMRVSLTFLHKVIKSAGVRNLSNGVQLGRIAWLIKANDAMESARLTLSLLEKSDG